MGASAAYVILSHRHPERVERLIERILALSPDSAVLVSHDARASSAPRFDSPRVTVDVHVEATDWGSWDLVAASLAALQRAADLFDPQLLVLISGQDYPARNLAHWEQEVLASGSGWVCAFLHELHYHPRWGRSYGSGNDTKTRYMYRWYRLPGGRWAHHSPSLAARLTRYALSRAGHYLEPVLAVRTVTRGRGYHVGIRAVRSPFTDDEPCLMGSQWMALDRRRLTTLIDCLRNDRKLRRTYRHSIIPDESVFQTVLGRTGAPMPGGIVSHIVWELQNDAPRVLTAQDLPEILASGAPFCRKLEPGESDELVDALDRVAADH